MSRQKKEIEDAVIAEAKSWRILRTLSIGLVVFVGMFCFFAYTPAKTFIPGYPDARTKRANIQNAIKVDSLEAVIARWELYSENLARVLEGKEPIPTDSIIAISARQAASQSIEEAMKYRKQDSLLRKEIRDAEQFEVSNKKQRNLQVEGMHFFTPVKGNVTKTFEKNKHPYIEIKTSPNSVIMSPLDGTVIFAGWNDDSGYTIAIQHASNLVTIIKHNQRLLRKAGDKIAAGSSIALAGADLTTGDSIRIELWLEGEAVDPAAYIKF